MPALLPHTLSAVKEARFPLEPDRDRMCSHQVGENAIYYSTHYAAQDYISLFGALRAAGTAQLALYCLSYGTYFCNS
jgi:hypothetical protein